MTSAIAIGLGPVIGGLLIDAIGWRAIFAMDIPPALLVGILVAVDVGESPRRERGGLDPRGQVTAVVALAALTFAVIQSGSDGWLDARVLAPLALAGQPVGLSGIRTAFAVAVGSLAVSGLLGLLIPSHGGRADELTVSETVAASEA